MEIRENVALAGGSNLLVSDHGFNGLVIKIAMDDVAFRRSSARAGAGVALKTLIQSAGERGLSEMENLYGIPGILGGAVRG